MCVCVCVCPQLEPNTTGITFPPELAAPAPPQGPYTNGPEGLLPWPQSDSVQTVSSSSDDSSVDTSDADSGPMYVTDSDTDSGPREGADSGPREGADAGPDIAAMAAPVAGAGQTGAAPGAAAAGPVRTLTRNRGAASTGRTQVCVRTEHESTCFHPWFGPLHCAQTMNNCARVLRVQTCSMHCFVLLAARQDMRCCAFMPCVQQAQRRVPIVPHPEPQLQTPAQGPPKRTRKAAGGAERHTPAPSGSKRPVRGEQPKGRQASARGNKALGQQGDTGVPPMQRRQRVSGGVLSHSEAQVTEQQGDTGVRPPPGDRPARGLEGAGAARPPSDIGPRVLPARGRKRPHHSAQGVADAHVQSEGRLAASGDSSGAQAHGAVQAPQDAAPHPQRPTAAQCRAAVPGAQARGTAQGAAGVPPGAAAAVRPADTAQQAASPVCPLAAEAAEAGGPASALHSADTQQVRR